jgi:fatty acid desaturase
MSVEPLSTVADRPRGNTFFAWQELPTFLLFIACLGGWAVALMLPVRWGILSFAVLVFVLVLHSSLTHEIIHGHPFRKTWANTALGIVQLGLFVPFLRFKDLHLAHHYDEFLTDPYDDPESNYLDPEIWDEMGKNYQLLCRINNTLLGRMVLGPAIGMAYFIAADLRAILGGDRGVLSHWLAHLPGIIAVLWIVSLAAMPVWVYLLACYGAMSVLKIRTFAEHRAHARASARTVVIEDRGILGFLFLFNNFHVVHHIHPQVCWYKLPALYDCQKERFLRRNQGYVFPSYVEVFRNYFLHAKDPVPHPIWRGRQG